MLELGAVISVSGLAFRPGEEATAAVVRLAPADRLIVETDSPFLSPPGAPRGRNAPEWVAVTAAWVADLRDMDADQLGSSLVETYISTFRAGRTAPDERSEPLRPPPNRVRRRVRPEIDLEEPIQAELFSVERLEDHARSLARAQTITTKPSDGRSVASRLAENGRVLVESYRASRGRSRGAHDHAGGRMARRQLPGRRRAAPRDPRRPSRRTTTASSRSSPTATSTDIRGSSAWPGPTSPTRTASSTPTACGGWSAPTRRSSR